MIERIIALERALENYRQYKTSIEDLETDVMYLKQRLDAYEKRVIWAKYCKSPHKCPVCDGSGGVKHPLTGLIEPAKCHVCEGKGIVWG